MPPRAMQGSTWEQDETAAPVDGRLGSDRTSGCPWVPAERCGGLLRVISQASRKGRPVGLRARGSAAGA